jgi:hypothetical protein
MVDMQKVKERLMRGAFVGAGSFASSFAGSFIEQYAPGGDITTGAGQVALGLGISVGVDEVFTQPDSVPNEAVEFVGYGVQGAGFANLGESIQAGAQTGRVVNVNSRSAQAQGQNNNQASQQASASTGYSLDTA